jgi:hypothetical protein
MKQLIAKNKRHLAGLAACLLIGGVTLSFQDSPFVHAKTDQTEQVADAEDPIACKDTLPPGKKMTSQELDKLEVELEQALKLAGEKLKEIDLGKLNLQIADALKQIDMEKIKTSVEQSLKAVDFASIEKEVNNALKEVDMNKINMEVKQALQEAKREMEKVNWADINKELADARIELEKAQQELKGIDMDKIMSEAKQGIEKAKTELKQFKEMVTEMEKDGLIDRKKGFKKITFEDGSLYIDGKKQSQAISDKYRKYTKDGKLNINFDGEEKEVVEL